VDLRDATECARPVDAAEHCAVRLSSKLARRVIHRLERIAGPAPVPVQDPLETQAFADLSEFERYVVRAVEPHTMTTPERIVSLIRAVRHVVDSDIAGAIAECGVWRGGSMMVVALTLLERGVTDRDLYLFDTFEGMSEPTAFDVHAESGVAASEILASKQKDTSDHDWAYCPRHDVERNLVSTNYPAQRIHFIEGRVEDTIPGQAPHEIAILRLDTDWYESTKHELVHLYPRLSPNGVLILDDYGHWEGARKAVDEYLEQQQVPMLLARMDYAGRIAIKPPPFAGA